MCPAPLPLRLATKWTVPERKQRAGALASPRLASDLSHPLPARYFFDWSLFFGSDPQPPTVLLLRALSHRLDTIIPSLLGAVTLCQIQI